MDVNVVPLPTATMCSLCFGWCVNHCSFHLGIVITGNPRKLCGIYMRPVATMGDLSMGWCGIFSPIVTGKYTNLNGKMRPTARVTDKFVGPWSGTIIEGVYTELT